MAAERVSSDDDTPQVQLFNEGSDVFEQGP
jgi:hypothetical protein